MTAKILLYTLFKVGSTSLADFLKSNYNFSETWQNDGEGKIISDYKKAEGFILRGHTLPLTPLLNHKELKFDCWITSIRKPNEIYPSCYFQDITTAGYPYYFGYPKQVMDSGIETLIHHFLSFDWQWFEQSNYDFNFKQIQNYTGVNLWEEDFNKQMGFNVYKSKKSQFKYVGIIRMDKISDLHTLLDFFKQMGITALTKNVVFHNSNSGQNKWYRDKYKNFLSNLPKSYYIRYNDVNEVIVNKYYE